MTATHAPTDREQTGLLDPTPLFGALLVLLVLAYWPGLEQPGRVARESSLLAGAPLLLGLSLLRRQARPGNLFLVLLGVLAVSGLAHILFSAGPERLAVARDFAVLAAPWCVALAVALAVGDRERFDTAIETAAVLALFATGLLGLTQAWFGWSAVEQLGPPAATFVNRNVAAQSLVALIPLVMPALLAGRNHWNRWAASVSAGVGLAFLVATRTRGAWLGALVGAALGVALLVARREKLPRLRQAAAPLGLVLAFGLAALFVPVIEGPGKRMPSIGERLSELSQPFRGSGVIRRALLENSTFLAVERPLGVGPGRFPVVYPLYHAARRPTPGFGMGNQAEHAHNDLLEYAVELGAPGALAVALLLVGAVVLCWRGSSGDSPRALYRDAGRAAALAGLAVHGLVSFPLHSPASAYLAFLLLGRCWACSGRPCAPSPSTRLLAILLFATLPAALWIGSREIRSQSALRDARIAHASGDCATALSRSDEVFRQARWRRRDRGVAAMIRFECAKDAGSSLPALERALAMQPHRLELLLATGARRLKAGHAVEAETAFLHAVEVVPGHARGWLGLAMSRLSLGNRAGATEACARSLRLEPGLRPARTFCGGNGLARGPRQPTR